MLERERERERVICGDASKRHSYATPPNNEPFLLKQVTNRIQICQGCRISIRGRGGRIEDPPFDFCVSRMERRPSPTPEGKFRIPTVASNCHYHLRTNRITAVEPSFVEKALKIPKEVECCLLHNANEFGKPSKNKNTLYCLNKTT